MSAVLEKLLQELKFKHDTPTGTPATPYMYGPGGLFGVAGAEREIISTRIHPRGLATHLPARATTRMMPYFPYMTGFLDVTGSNPDGVCDDAQTAGPMKNCFQTAQFGRYTFMTRELELNRLGQQLHRGEFQDLYLVNPPMLQGDDLITPNVGGNPSLANEVAVRMMEVGVAFQNKLIPQVYVGNPANNSAGGGYQEFPGLDILIGTNKVDAFTGAECASLDSDIKNFNYELVTSGSIVNVLSYMMRYLGFNAERGNFGQVNYAFVMREALWWELSAVWPCAYLTYRCSGQANTNVTTELGIPANEFVRFRDEMRRNKYLIIDGVQYPVITDDGIVEETAGDNGNISEGCFASDIYIVPMSANGMALTFWEYLDYSKGAMIGAQEGNLAPGDFWTDGGRYLWHKKPPKNWCVQWISKLEPRLILRTPHLAGRLTNVQYCPLQHERQPFADDPYHLNGGVSVSRTYTTPYSDWNLPG
jgi:hypothetical protein